MRADGGSDQVPATEMPRHRWNQGDLGEVESQCLVKDGKEVPLSEAVLLPLALAFRRECGQAGGTQTCGLLGGWGWGWGCLRG